MGEKWVWIFTFNFIIDIFYFDKIIGINQIKILLSESN